MWFFYRQSRNETYFEHVYLSSYLGLLVEGSDLLVRDMFLKTIDQLERVDVIIKRIDDQWCDPLDNKVHYIRTTRAQKRNVSVILQVSVLENHGLMAFIQNACKFY
jgi:uncharacterized circularly permuted ATP-grasp superfamily protein